MRILAFPFIAVIHLIFSVLMYFRTLYLLARYGGESIVYDKTNNRDTIMMVYKKLVETQTP